MVTHKNQNRPTSTNVTYKIQNRHKVRTNKKAPYSVYKTGRRCNEK